MSLSLEAREALELRFDGKIPTYLLTTEAEAMAGHHRTMIRFSETRIGDFSESLTKLRARPDSDPTKALWIARTVAIIAEHEAELANHRAALAALLPAPAIAAE